MLPVARSSRIRRALPLATGQTTVYIVGDNGTHQVGENHNYESLITGQYSGSVAIVINGKTDNHSNNVVKDHSTGLMWTKTASASVGTASNGTLPWTTNGSGEGIFPYAAAANTAGLALYSDWRIPTDLELLGLRNMEAPSAYPDAAHFPSWPTNAWTSVTQPNITTNAYAVNFNVGSLNNGVPKTTGTTFYVVLVRKF